jgi:antitoxin VapB
MQDNSEFARTGALESSPDSGRHPVYTSIYTGGEAVALAKKLTEYPVRLFRHGGSQAARLPKELRINASEAIGYRKGDIVLLRPAPMKTWPKGYWESFGPVGEDFTAPKALPPTPHRDSVLKAL